MFVGTYWTIQEPISVFRQSYSPQGARLHTQTVATTEQIIPRTTEKIWSTWNGIGNSGKMRGRVSLSLSLLLLLLLSLLLLLLLSLLLLLLLLLLHVGWRFNE